MNLIEMLFFYSANTCAKKDDNIYHRYSPNSQQLQQYLTSHMIFLESYEFQMSINSYNRR